MELTREVIETTIFEILSEKEQKRVPMKTSPTEVCKKLYEQGYKESMNGRHLFTMKPNSDVFDVVCAVAQKSFTYKIHGNFRSISL